MVTERFQTTLLTIRVPLPGLPEVGERRSPSPAFSLNLSSADLFTAALRLGNAVDSDSDVVVGLNVAECRVNGEHAESQSSLAGTRRLLQPAISFTQPTTKLMAFTQTVK